MGYFVRPFPWLGSKTKTLSWLLPLLPERPLFIDAFGGSGSILANRSPAKIEIFNDLDNDVVNFFRVLRGQTSALIEALEWTPYARAELEHGGGGNDPLERARRFFFVQSAVYPPAKLKRTSYKIRRQIGSEARTFQNRISRLAWLAERFADVQIECRPAIKVIRDYATAESLIYCDPPYPSDARREAKYPTDMSDDQYAELVAVLGKAPGLVAVSSYGGGLSEQLFKGWVRHDAPAQTYVVRTSAGNRTQQRREALFCNYEPGGQGW